MIGPALRRAGAAGGLALAAACGGTGYTVTSHPSNVVTTVTSATGGTTNVALSQGETLEVRVANLDETEVSPAGVLRQENPGPGVAQFIAVGPGRATIRLLHADMCQGPSLCTGEKVVTSFVVAVVR